MNVQKEDLPDFSKINYHANVMENLSYTLAIAFIVSLILLQFTNKSNISSYIAVPLLTGGLLKYVLGDSGEEGLKWAASDLQYFSAIFVTSYATTMLISKNT
ncbi:MAG: hypothetical protein CBC22_04765 [Alphaproteobacteria bacterium TMED62]|nr:MAG: hypothetical protein CBC22_04765 [Alphaproteobacteria bacterium TMED62]|tara:strand:+ start:784 stop:1089 length:306 start_codon:yes stop_codon:yes gene_type:complete